MDLKGKLLELTGGVKFRFDANVLSPAELKEMADYNLSQYDKLKAMGEERVLRIEELIWALLGDVLQPLAISRYGSADDSAVRAVLVGELSNPKLRDSQDRFQTEGVHSPTPGRKSKGKTLD